MNNNVWKVIGFHWFNTISKQESVLDPNKMHFVHILFYTPPPIFPSPEELATKTEKIKRVENIAERFV